MRIALINENSQAAKNAAIEAALKKVVTPMGHQVDNYGMYGKEGEMMSAHYKMSAMIV